MAPWRAALGRPGPNRRWMLASICSSSPNLSLLGLEGCPGLALRPFLLPLGERSPASVRMRRGGL